MAINQNHLFEDLDGIKCAIVEKNVLTQRASFLQSLLAFNGYTVVVIPSPPPKAAPAPAPASAAAPEPPAEGNAASTPISIPTPAPPETFTVGVTDTAFNPINAIFGRLLRTPDGHIVTLAYWRGTEKESHDEVPYFESGNS